MKVRKYILRIERLLRVKSGDNLIFYVELSITYLMSFKFQVTSLIATINKFTREKKKTIKELVSTSILIVSLL